MGVLTAAHGAFLIIYPLATATITTVLLGWVLIFVGIALFVFALHSQTVGNFFMKILLSLLYGICGIALAFFPLAGVAALTLMLGTLLLIQAGTLSAIALHLKSVERLGLVSDGCRNQLGAERSDSRQVASSRKGFLFVQFIFACTTCAEKIENAIRLNQDLVMHQENASEREEFGNPVKRTD